MDFSFLIFVEPQLEAVKMYDMSLNVQILRKYNYLEHWSNNYYLYHSPRSGPVCLNTGKKIIDIGKMEQYRSTVITRIRGTLIFTYFYRFLPPIW